MIEALLLTVLSAYRTSQTPPPHLGVILHHRIHIIDNRSLPLSSRSTLTSITVAGGPKVLLGTLAFTCTSWPLANCRAMLYPSLPGDVYMMKFNFLVKWGRRKSVFSMAGSAM